MNIIKKIVFIFILSTALLSAENTAPVAIGKAELRSFTTQLKRQRLNRPELRKKDSARAIKKEGRSHLVSGKKRRTVQSSSIDTSEGKSFKGNGQAKNNKKEELSRRDKFNLRQTPARKIVMAKGKRDKHLRRSREFREKDIHTRKDGQKGHNFRKGRRPSL